MSERDEIIELGKEVTLIMEKHESLLTGELRREMEHWKLLTEENANEDN